MADVAACETARFGIDDHDPAPAQRREVLLHRGVFPHLGVHRGAHDDRCCRGQQGGGQQLVGDAGCVGADEAGRRRGDDDCVGALAHARVGNRVVAVPQ
jgi:hypothetical protein